MSWGNENTLEAPKTTQQITAKFIGYRLDIHMSRLDIRMSKLKLYDGHMYVQAINIPIGLGIRLSNLGVGFGHMYVQAYNTGWTKDLYKDSTFEIEVGPDILNYIFAPLVPFNYNFRC